MTGSTDDAPPHRNAPDRDPQRPAADRRQAGDNGGDLTLLEFLEDAGAEVLVFDAGRRVGRLARDDFLAFERARVPYPLPLQRQAWIALVQVPRTPGQASPEPVVWFLRLSLDEQGLLVQAERDYLLSRLFESARAGRGAGGDFLRDNPHAFKPRAERMALLHAFLGTELGRPPSRFYAHALDYFSGGPGWDQWEFVGYQGIADMAARHAAAPLDAAVPHLPREPLIALCHCLESRSVAPTLEAVLLKRLEDAAIGTSGDANLVAALIRGLAGNATRPAVQAALDTLLATALGREIEVLTAVSGRAWEALHAPALLDRYLLGLATNTHGSSAFDPCISDLLSLPALAGPVRDALRSGRQPAAVRSAFARMTARHDH